MLIFLRSRFLGLILTLANDCIGNLKTLDSLLNEDTLMLELAFDERKKILDQISALKKVESSSGSLVTRLERILETSVATMSENYNQGAEVLSQVRVSAFKNMYEQFKDMKKTMLFLAQSNKDYKGEEFSPDSRFEKVDSLPSLSAQLIDMLKSGYSPPLKSLMSLKLSHRPILGPYKYKPTGVIYIGQFKNSCSDGLTFRVNKDGGFFYGEYKGGSINGIGFRGYSDGHTYFGQFKDSQSNGSGVYRWPHGDVYEGEFKEGESNGQGTFTWKDGRRYEGELKNDKRHGLGLIKYTNGDTYNGEWSECKRHGKGVFTW